MLANAIVTAMVGTMRPDAAKAFYRDTLGLTLSGEDGYAMIFAGKNARVRVSRVPAVTPAAYAVIAFTVDDIEAVADALIAKGVQMARFPIFTQDARGVWSAPGGAKVAWFHDPDMNLLSVVQNP
jgi:catechol 2,3-dioxygenase-like lactoylglutathione lyase family enzyme